MAKQPKKTQQRARQTASQGHSEADPGALRLEYLDPAELEANPSNWRTHPQAQTVALAAAIKQVGWAGALLWNERTKRLIDGHARKQLFAGKGKVPVLIGSWTEEQEKLILATLDPLAAMAQTDDTALAALLYEARTDDQALQAMLAGLAQDNGISLTQPTVPPTDPGPQIDRAVELQAKWGTATGQLWVIPSKATPGLEHRLLCGDSTKAEDVGRVMGGERAQGAFTSPPYAEQRKDTYGGVPADRYVDWWEAVQAGVRSVLAADGSFFVNINPHAENGERSLYVADLTLAMKRKWGWRHVDEFCWRDTRNGMPGTWPNRFKDAWEPVFHFSLEKAIKFRPENVSHDSDACFDYSPETKRGEGRNGMKTGTPAGGTREGKARPSNVLDIPAASDCSEHPAGFPVALPTFFLKAFSDPGDTWLDPFAGSGTTLVAAEQTARLCYAIEISSAYVAVAIERLAGLGLSPQLSNPTSP